MERRTPEHTREHAIDPRYAHNDTVKSALDMQPHTKEQLDELKVKYVEREDLKAKAAHHEALQEANAAFVDAIQQITESTDETLQRLTAALALTSILGNLTTAERNQVRSLLHAPLETLVHLRRLLTATPTDVQILLAASLRVSRFSDRRHAEVVREEAKTADATNNVSGRDILETTARFLEDAKEPPSVGSQRDAGFTAPDGSKVDIASQLARAEKLGEGPDPLPSVPDRDAPGEAPKGD